ncbi:MAG: c-type cytochrome [Steroidobacteraceae bacterium]
MERAMRLVFHKAITGLFLSGSAFAADAIHGKALFTACLACHTESPDALGPSLKGVVGRKAGSLEDFRYSNAMMRSGIIWDDANLRDFLRDPQAKIRGNHMPFSGFANTSDADDLIAYLNTYK